MNAYPNSVENFHYYTVCQLNISKMLRSALPNHRTMTSIFLYSGIDIDNKPILFIWLNISICGQKNIRTTRINAFLMGYL